MTAVNDYRVSKIVVLCKDCGQDVGLYPARHKCEQVIHPPLSPLPGLPIKKAPSPPLSSSPSSKAKARRNMTMHAAPRPSEEQWKAATHTVSARSRSQQQLEQEDKSIYFDKYAANLPSEPSTGKRLWGKVRGNETLKQLGKPKSAAATTLWNKILDRVSEKLPATFDDSDPESDDSDWEGETHVSRVLREYYEKKGAPLPSWLLDERTPQSTTTRATDRRPEMPLYKQEEEELARRPSRRNRKLWEVDDDKQLDDRRTDRLQHQALEPIREKGIRHEDVTDPRNRRRVYTGFENEEINARPSVAANDGSSRQDIVDDIYNDYYSASSLDNFVARSRSERRPNWGARSNTLDDMPSARLARQKATLEHRRGRVYF